MPYILKVQTCSCGKIEGKKTILANWSRVGITTKFGDNGTFLDNKELCLENNYCPQCGAKYLDEIRYGEREER